jgi:hypothetical protein
MTTLNMDTGPSAAASRASAARPGCIVCGATPRTPLYRVLEQCGECGFVRADLAIGEDEIKKLYQEDYFRGTEYGDYLADCRVHRKNFAYRFEELTRLAGSLESLFEIGCAYGFWLECAAGRGVRCAGVDLCAEAVAHAVKVFGQHASAEDFLCKDLQPGAYQAFCMWDTIEHLAHPELFVDRIHQLLPSGGWFFATTGDIGSKTARRRGSRWRMIHPPTHLQYFSTATMRLFLERRGFEVVAIHSTPMYRSMRGTLSGLLALGKGLPRRAAWLADKLLPGAIQDRVGFWLDLGDIMLVAARKP